MRSVTSGATSTTRALKTSTSLQHLDAARRALTLAPSRGRVRASTARTCAARSWTTTEHVRRVCRGWPRADAGAGLGGIRRRRSGGRPRPARTATDGEGIDVEVAATEERRDAVKHAGDVFHVSDERMFGHDGCGLARDLADLAGLAAGFGARADFTRLLIAASTLVSVKTFGSRRGGHLPVLVGTGFEHHVLLRTADHLIEVGAGRAPWGTRCPPSRPRKSMTTVPAVVRKRFPRRRLFERRSAW